MRIAHVIDYFHTDVGYQEYYLALSMAAAGHEVSVITSEFRQHTVSEVVDDGGVGARRLEAAGVEVIRLPAFQLGHDRVFLRGLENALIRFRPDVVHCHGPFSPTTLRSARFSRRSGTPLLVDSHIHEAIAPASATLVGRTVYATYRVAAGPYLRRTVGDWVANGPFEADFLEKRLGLEHNSVTLVPLGFDRDLFAADEGAGRHERACRGWGNELIVAATGKLHSGKRVDLTAAACERLANNRTVRLVLAGTLDSAVLESVKAAAPTLLASGLLTVLPMLPASELAALYRAVDAVVFARLPSISIYEAAGTGALVVLGQDRFADWLAGLHRGIVSTDPGRFADVLARRADRLQLATDAAEAFSWPVISEHFCDRYRRLEEAHA